MSKLFTFILASAVLVGAARPVVADEVQIFTVAGKGIGLHTLVNISKFVMSGVDIKMYVADLNSCNYIDDAQYNNLGRKGEGVEVMDPSMIDSNEYLQTTQIPIERTRKRLNFVMPFLSLLPEITEDKGNAKSKAAGVNSVCTTGILPVVYKNSVGKVSRLDAGHDDFEEILKAVRAGGQYDYRKDMNRYRRVPSSILDLG